MNKKFNLRNVVAVAICLVGLMAFVGCEKDDHSSLVGKWVSSSSLIEGRVIVFTEDYRVEQYLDHILDRRETPYGYSLPYATFSLSRNRITFTIHEFYPTATNFSETFPYTLSGNSLIIKHFNRPFSNDLGIRFDMHFTRIK